MDHKKLNILVISLTFSILGLLTIAGIITNNSNNKTVSDSNISQNLVSSGNEVSDDTISDNTLSSDNEVDDNSASASNNDAGIDNDDINISEVIDESTDIDTIENTDETEINKDSDNATVDITNNTISENAALDNTKTNGTVPTLSVEEIRALSVKKYNLTETDWHIINTDAPVSENPKFALYVNKSLNVVTAYVIDSDNNQIPFKAMLCSCGRQFHTTPAGTFKTSDYYEWRLMVDGTYGKYAVRFNNKILFHSVPYIATSGDSLEWDQFNLLGENASLGCVRMAVQDVKWIYDNCPKGTKVVVYEDVDCSGPLGKPNGVKIVPNSIYRNWDPTDPNENNPWKNLNK